MFTPLIMDTKSPKGQKLHAYIEASERRERQERLEMPPLEHHSSKIKWKANAPIGCLQSMPQE